jgi:hypothetical protein
VTPEGLKGAVVTLNGDRWTVVDVAPAQPLAEMVAALLEEEGMVAVVRGADPMDDVTSHLGAPGVGTTVVMVPEADAERALALIADTVTDFEGEELAAALASGELTLEELGDPGDADDEEGAEPDDADPDDLPPTGGAGGAQA